MKRAQFEVGSDYTDGTVGEPMIYQGTYPGPARKQSCPSWQMHDESVLVAARMASERISCLLLLLDNNETSVAVGDNMDEDRSIRLQSRETQRLF